MQSVVIPAHHFLKRVKQEYSNYQSAFIRELDQNARDAGATEIHFGTHEDHITFFDNGRGIAAEDMEKALFTLGGSIKSDDSVGGFGCAKELILFAHHHYVIDTGTCHVEGSGPNYEITTRAESYAGTFFIITFDPEWYYSQDDFKTRVIEFSKHCVLPNTKIFLNGTEIATGIRGKKTELESSAGMLMRVKLPEGQTSNHIVVRSGGLVMFTHQSGKHHPHQYFLDVPSPSTQYLTQNRDWFRDPYNIAFTKMMESLCVDGDSATDRVSRLHLYSPKNIPDAIGASTPSVSSDNLCNADAVFRMINTIVESAITAAPIPNAPVRRDPNVPVFETAPILTRHLLVDLADSDYSAPPKKMMPENLSSRNEWILKAWIWMLSFVLEKQKYTGDLSILWSIGFTLHSKQYACTSLPFSKMSDLQDRKLKRMRFFLINPPHIAGKTKVELLASLYSSAVHEVSHISVDWHDEQFATRMTDIVESTAFALPPRGRILRQIENIAL